MFIMNKSIFPVIRSYNERDLIMCYVLITSPLLEGYKLERGMSFLMVPVK